jgi:acetyl-CoA carboxylase biotin carboxyl carrier protein
VEINDLEELIRLFEKSKLHEIEIEEEGKKIRLQKPQAPSSVPMSYPVAAPPASMPAAPVEQAPGPIEQTASSAAPKLEDGLVTIDSPMVGTYYSAPAPGEPPFVQRGDMVDEGQTVCIVEAMKLMNEVGAKFSGSIEKILVENGQPVEFGQPLFAVKP